MADEVRDISIVVQSTQAIKGLVSVANSLDNVATLSGRTDAGLRRAERAIAKASETSLKAARTIAALKNELKAMSMQTTKSHREVTVLAAKLQTANRRLAEQKQIVQTQKGLILSLSQSNLRLSQSYDKVASSAAKANAEMSKKPKDYGLAKKFENSQPLAQTPGGGWSQGGAVPLQKAGASSAPRTTSKSAVKDVTANPIDNSLRYQLYDIAATFGVVGAAALVAGTTVSRVGIEWDKNFANVVRTSQVTGTAVSWLKDEFLDLQSSIPVTSADLATIATLGAQMGVAAANLANFTEITAKFSSTSGLSVDESATALSRLDQLLPDVEGNYERLASAILKTGVNAVATEAQIVRGTNQIASMGRIAGLTTPEVIALASSMSSLGLSPELQRSIITSSFSRILTATSQVTAQTEKFGAVLNMTGKEFQTAFRDDAVGTYQRLLSTIAARGDAVTVLQDLGLASQRLTPNLLKMGQNTEVFSEALADTTEDWDKTEELTRQYGITASTVSAKIQVMTQAWEALLVTLDDSETLIGPLVDGLTGILKWLRSIAATPGVSQLASIATVIVTLSGVTALAVAGLAAMAAGYIAISAVQATATAATLVNTGAVALNSTAITINDTLRARSTLGLSAQTLTLAGNTVAVGANTAATATSGAGMLGWASKILKALPALLAVTGAVAGLTAAAAGLYTIIGTADNWTVELDKGLNGVNTPEKTFEYNYEQLRKLDAQMKDMRKEQEKWDKYIANGGSEWVSDRPGGKNGYNFRDSIAERNVTGQYEKYYADLEEAVLGLTNVEDQYRAVNSIARELGITQEELLNDILPGLGSALGEGAQAAAEMQDSVEKLESAQALWAASLLTSDVNLTKLKEGLTQGASAYLDFGSALTAAYDGDEENGEGLSSFLDGMNNQIAGFEAFYADLGTLTQRGGVQLATLFASQGPAAAQALADSLTLSPEQISQIENQMALAAFYASEEFADTFSQNNAILANVWRQTNSTEAVAAFNTALADSMKGGYIDPAVLAALSAQYGVNIDAQVIPSIDKEALALEQATLNSTALTVPVKTSFKDAILNGPSSIATEVEAWQVELNGHALIMPIDPNTEEGKALVAEWRDNEYQTPASIKVWAETLDADATVNTWRYMQEARVVTITVRANVPTVSINGETRRLNPGEIATGGMINNGRIVRDNYPAYARGAILRGPGTGTSDSILARVSNGEAITKARAVRYYGTSMMNDINNMRFPRYATGHTPSGGYGPGSSGAGQTVNVNVTQNYPTTRDPIKKLKQDAESVLAGIWT